MSYSARAVASALLSSMKRANRRRLLRSTCVSMHRFEGGVPMTVSDVCVQLVVAGLVTMIFRV